MHDHSLPSNEQWRKRLTALEYHVLREKGTEPPGSGDYITTTQEGIYSCRACGTELFRSTEKFDAHCGWPAFFSPLAQDRITEHVDYDLGYPRTEVRCAYCGSHLGHVFAGEGFDTPTDLRYCINSVCLTFSETQHKEAGNSSPNQGNHHRQ